MRLMKIYRVIRLDWDDADILTEKLNDNLQNDEEVETVGNDPDGLIVVVSRRIDTDAV